MLTPSNINNERWLVRFENTKWRCSHNFHLGSHYIAAALFEVRSVKWNLDSRTERSLFSVCQGHIMDCSSFIVETASISCKWCDRSFVWFNGNHPKRLTVVFMFEGCMRSMFVYTIAVHPTAAFIDVPKSCERRLTCKEKLYCWGTSSFICRCESRWLLLCCGSSFLFDYAER